MASQEKDTPKLQQGSNKIQNWITAVAEYASSGSDQGSDQGPETKTDATAEEKTSDSDLIDKPNEKIKYPGLGDIPMSKVDEDIMIFVWLADQDFFTTGVVNWPPVLREMQKNCKWSLDPTIIVQRWKRVVFPRIQATQRAVKEFERKRREESANWADFPPPVDRDSPIEMTDEDYKHSLGPYAKRVIKKYGNGQGLPSPVLHKKPVDETPYDGPLLEPKIYVPPDSEKPSTRGYVGTEFVGPKQVVPAPSQAAPAPSQEALPPGRYRYPPNGPPVPSPRGIGDWAMRELDDEGIDVSEDIYD